MPELIGFASLPADTFADGPESGADVDTTRTGPFPGQPVGGWSGVQFADANSYWFIVDSLFGGSSDTLARIYKVNPNFAGIEGGDGSVELEDFITLTDPNNLVPFEILNENDSERPLTGTDFDTEALVIDSNGDLWVGDEYGPYLLHFDSNGVLLEAPIATPNIPRLNTLNGQIPINIGHRGASGPRPEHTLDGFRLALEQGADFIETDYVMTSDGVPIVRHEPLLNNTTNILDILDENPDFAARETTKTIDGVEYEGLFAEDFTLEEIKTLRARQPREERSDEFDDLFEIPTMAEVIQLVKDFTEETGEEVGIVHELKHNSYFDSIGLNLEEATVQVLLEEDFTDPEQNIIQTFEIAPLISLDQEIMPDAGIDVPLHQLTGAATENFNPGFSFPYDLIDNFSDPDFTEDDARAVYGDLVDIIELNEETGYGDLLALPEFYEFMGTYAEAVNPWKNTILLREGLDEPVDGDGDGNAEIRTQLTGEVFPLIDFAHDAELLVNVYTLRDEERYLTLNPDGTVQTPTQEVEDLINLGVDGLIGDFPETIEEVLDRFFADEVRAPQNPDVEAGDALANLRGSRGFEGIGYSPDGTTLYPILEAPVDGDPENSLRIYEYDIETGTYSNEIVGLYPLDDPGDTPTFQLGDLTPVNDTQFIAIERDDFQADEAFFKKLFLIDISQVDENGFVSKTELVDLLDIDDPNDLDGNGSNNFTLPITSIEDVLVFDEETILVSVDNNYPFGDFATGRPPELDNNEIILVQLDEPLDLDPRLGINGLPDPEPIFNPEAERAEVRSIEFIGESSIPAALDFQGTEVGGFSGLTYDADNGVYYAISDDRSNINPGRYYTLDINLNGGNGLDVSVAEVTTLLDENEDVFEEESLDPEGIVLTSDGTVFISSEGNTEELVNPFVNEFALTGEQLNELEIPQKFLPTADNSSGIRNNLAFESLTIDPQERFLFTGIENALFQDGPAAGIDQTSLARIIQYDLATGEPTAEFVYETDNANAPAGTPDSVDRTNSLAELVALDNSGTFLALERYFDDNGLNQNKLYLASAQNATDVSDFDSLVGQDIVVAEKELLVDFNDIDTDFDGLDDFEGLALGPVLPDGRQSLIVVSDNDFDPAQETQFFAFALDLGLSPTRSDDRLVGTEESDNIASSAGDDVIDGRGGNDNLNAGRGNDKVFGKSGNDLLIGRPGNDILLGGPGDDTLEGGIGRDRLNGGAGNDVLTGGGGIDRFIFNTNQPFDSNDMGVDTITDFSTTQGDIILLDLGTFTAINSEPGTGFSINSEFVTVASDGDAATADAVIVYNENNGNLFYNPNGNEPGFGSGGQFATLTDPFLLVADDFFIRS